MEPATPTPAQTTNLLGALATAALDLTDAALEDALAPGGRLTQALLTLDTWPGSSIRFLSRVLDVTHSGAVRLVDRLEDRGLAERALGPDGRTVAVRATRSGRDVVSRLRARRAEALGGLIRDLTERDRLTLHGLLERMLGSGPRTRTEARHTCRVCDHSLCRGEACPVGSSVTVEDG